MNVGLGPQTYANGYKDAGVYVNGKVEQGVAGGVCQVTSTLYNAVILAELEVVERYPHSMTVGYVPLGRDAAVAGDYKDLKFKNNTEYPVYLEAYVSTYKIVTENGKQISKDWFSSSTYRATADEVTVGTKKAEAPAQQTPAQQTPVEEKPAVETPATSTEEKPVTEAPTENTDSQVVDNTPIGAE